MTISALVPHRPHRPLLIAAASMAALFLVSLGGLLFDARQILGDPIWLKTVKFAISMALYLATLAWLIGLLPKARGWGWWLGTVVAVGLTIDVALLVVQMIGRGRRLHFNVADESDRLIHNLLATGAYTAFAATAVLALLLCFQRLRDIAEATAVRAGLGLSVLGMAVATMMFTPPPEQQAVIEAGGRPAIVGGHSVGATDGGPGLPLLGWSTEGGDLRIPHFVGLHGIQLLPLLAIALTMLTRRYPALVPATTRRALLRITAAGYLGVVLTLFWQAMRGQSIVDLSGPVPLVLLGLVVATGACWVLVLRRARHRTVDATDGAAREFSAVR